MPLRLRRIFFAAYHRGSVLHASSDTQDGACLDIAVSGFWVDISKEHTWM